MQSDTKEMVRPEIKLKASAGDYHVAGFSEKYATYLTGCYAGAGWSGGSVMAIGFLIALVGFGALIFGPETITYNRMTGPTLLQYVQMYPGPIFSVGGALFAVGTHLYARRAISREMFLLSCYRLIAQDGRDVTGEVKLGYLGGDNFNIAIL
ncbi:hypothetical protein F3J44_15925 [Pantoea sp. Tr-811]|uniref:hypothetical protein n=1 Tax=Pantoea sp. Tr-811 TaxID=2608361 RepID=UPI0014233902|nr:hypothetical protein [Pantoea sp. Tr-811]NIF27859.1 hypothetical protein [Pantoea sp. Tr-811]